jgi:hypothetical protein
LSVNTPAMLGLDCAGVMPGVTFALNMVLGQGGDRWKIGRVGTDERQRGRGYGLRSGGKTSSICSIGGLGGGVVGWGVGLKGGGMGEEGRREEVSSPSAVVLRREQTHRTHTRRTKNSKPNPTLPTLLATPD